jgi:hypothetical protein
MPTLNNVATSDAYNRVAYLECQGAIAANVIVTNAAVIMQVAEWPPAGGARWGDDEFLPPGGYSFQAAHAGAQSPHERLDGFRFRSAAAGVPARVSVKA